ncbi:hypothetical protein [Burkholderia ambifaria]|uniref:hypothetical protein n=1 Tax=Burkholderia ambifaria TaxID=152480 RepID=UPI0015890D45|nr:hypothetical protein [Burkholderia ambifaria]
MKLKDRADALDTVLSLFDRATAMLPIIIGTAGVSAISGWAASISQSVAHFGPIAWVAAGVVGGLLFLLGYLLWVKARTHTVRLLHARALMDKTDTINPLDDVFTKKRIRLEDFKKPLTEPVVGKTFVDCELMGPAVLYFGGQTSMNGTGFISCDFVAVKEKVYVQNVLPLMDATIRGGKIYQSTILIPKSNVHMIPKEASWITE